MLEVRPQSGPPQSSATQVAVQTLVGELRLVTQGPETQLCAAVGWSGDFGFIPLAVAGAPVSRLTVRDAPGPSAGPSATAFTERARQVLAT